MDKELSFQEEISADNTEPKLAPIFTNSASTPLSCKKVINHKKSKNPPIQKEEGK